jgi:hypothetical protein
VLWKKLVKISTDKDNDDHKAPEAELYTEANNQLLLLGAFHRDLGIAELWYCPHILQAQRNFPLNCSYASYQSTEALLKSSATPAP